MADKLELGEVSFNGSDEIGNMYLIRSAMDALRQSFIDDGDTYAVAESKRLELSVAITAAKAGCKTDFMLGDKAELIVQVDAATTTGLTTAKKTIITDILNS